MPVPEIVAFDLGKVLVDFDYSIAADRIAQHSNCDGARIHRLFSDPPLLNSFESGGMTSRQFYDAVCAETGFCRDYDEFCRYFADIFTAVDPMIDLHNRLRSRGVPTYILSNTNDIAIAHIRQRFPFFSNFTGYILSYEEGVMKPESGIYEALERLSGRQGSQVFYIDDRIENVEAGAARGWQVIHHGDPAPTIARVRELSLLGSH